MNAQLVQGFRQCEIHISYCLWEYFVERLQDKLHESSVDIGNGFLGETSGLVVEIDISPQAHGEIFGGESPVCVHVYFGERVEREAEAILRTGEHYIAQKGRN